jgi:hypothetical protein
MQVAPRPFGEVLGDAVTTFGRTWRALAPTALLVFVPAGLATLLLFRGSGALEIFDRILNEPSTMQTLPSEALQDLLLPFYRATVLATLVNVAAAAFVHAAAHMIAAADIAGAPPLRGVARRALRPALVGFVAWLIAALVGGLLFVIGFTLWLIPASAVGAPNATSTLIAGFLLPVVLAPGAWVLISASMATPVAALEGLGVNASLRRSMSLVRGRWWPTLGYLLLVGLFGVIAVQLIQLVAIPMMALGGVGPAVDIAAVVGILAQGLIVAGIGVMTTWWYVDLRSRKETLLSEDLQ